MQGAGAIEEGDNADLASVGDLIKVGLRADYATYDFEWPIILREAEEELDDYEIDIQKLHPFTDYSLERLRQFLVQEGETFLSQEVSTKTQFGRYVVTGDLFNARTYRDYLQKILRTILLRFDRVSAHKQLRLPTLQINDAQIMATLDCFIRTRLFGQPFDPFKQYDWKILLAQNGLVTQHLICEMDR